VGCRAGPTTRSPHANKTARARLKRRDSPRRPNALALQAARPAHASRTERLNRIVEIVCVVAVLIAIAALVVWIVANAGGGVLNQG
jgi:hypothetical protein